MLIEFKVANYLSFKDQATLSMVASSDNDAPENLIADVPGFKGRLLRSAAIYGANASGKSNLVRAMRFMHSFVLESATGRQRKDAIPVSPFKLDAECLERPATFEVSCIIHDELYVYGFSASPSRVEEEWLYTYPLGRRRILFERHTNKENETSASFGSSWTGERKSLVAQTRANALLLSVATQLDHELAGRVYDWFEQQFQPVTDPGRFYESPARAFSSAMVFNSPEFKEKMLRLLRMADLGIVDLQAEKQPLAESDMVRGLPEDLKTVILSKSPEDAYYYKIRTVHELSAANGDTATIEFDMEKEESSGTQKLFAIAGPFIDTLESGITLIMDEFDSDWHALLTLELIRMFHNPQLNKSNAQFIFTTHDDSLLDEGLFRRDQVFFVRKDQEGGTELYSLADIKDVRKKGINIRKRYRSGVYGGVPIIHDIVVNDMLTFEG